MKVIVAGSRNFDDYEILKGETTAFIRTLVEENFLDAGDEITIVSGGARGADKLGERYAKEHGYHCEIHIPDWSMGKQAGILRNIKMAEVSQACIVFNVNNSTGSRHMTDYAIKEGLTTKEVKCYF